jgi:two-component system, OmpR family, response regulator VicR
MATQHPISVLLIDDDEDWLFLVKTKLRNDGFSIDTSVNGVNIWDKIKAHLPDVILLDIHMNGVNGENFCQELKTNPKTSAIPVIMYSSNNDLETVAKRCGADGYIPKYVSLDTVKETLISYAPDS